MSEPDLFTMLQLHHHRARVERTKTEALIWFFRLFGYGAVLYIAYVLLYPVSAEERFFSAACKFPPVEQTPTVRKTCADIKALPSRGN